MVRRLPRRWDQQEEWVAFHSMFESGHRDVRALYDRRFVAAVTRLPNDVGTGRSDLGPRLRWP